MGFNVTRRQVFFVKSKNKNKKPRANWMKQAQQQVLTPGNKDNSLAVFGAGSYSRPVKKVSLARRLTGWTLSLAVLGVALWGTVLLTKAVMSKLDEQPTIAESIARSRPWRGQAAGMETAPAPISGERTHVAPTEESFIATSAYHASGSASAGAAAAPAAAAAPRSGAGKLEECGVASSGAGVPGAGLGDCLKKLGAYGDKK